MDDLSPDKRFQELQNQENFHLLNQLIDEGDENIDWVIKFMDTNHITHDQYIHKKWIDDIATVVYPIISAAEKGHVKILNCLIARGFDPNYKNSYITRMPIHYACRNGHVAVVKSLVTDHGVDANVVDSGEAVLFTAMYAGSVDVVKVLVEAGASVNGERRDHLPPLHWATLKYQAEIVEVLIAAGADVNKTNCNGYPPLNYVSCIGHSSMKVAQMLLEAGADPEAMCTSGTPFVTATKDNMLEFMKLLHKYEANPEAVSKDGYTPLQIAVTNENYEITRYLLVDLQVSLDYASRKYSPLQIALDAGSMKMVYLLIEAGGYRVGSDFFTYNESYEDTDGLLAYIRHHTQPRRLKHLCCFRLRQLLGKGLENTADYLPLPKRLIDFVKLNFIP